MGDRFHLVGRSRIDSVDMAAILGEFGGGGHPRAASATVKGQALSIAELRAKLEEILAARVKPLLIAAQMMSSPVKTVPPDATIEEAYRILLRNGHTGLPVVEEGKLVGVISRRDVDKARHHGLGHAPVSGYMSRNVLTITPDTSLNLIQQLMVKHDIGRLPVIANGTIVGIVTRTDVLRALHGDGFRHAHRFLFSESRRRSLNLSGDLAAKLPPATYTLLQRMSELAALRQVTLFVVGGFVRDFLLGQPSLDIDLVVEGDGIAFAEYLATELGATLHSYPEFGTASIFYRDGQRIDLAIARQEFYEYPAALPQVEYGSVTLQQDLYRRDFTINAMAISLNQADFGNLVDFFGGMADLQKGVIRVLYNLSFVEDPSRILRAIKYEQRYAFQIETETLGFLEQARDAGLLNELRPDRLREELILLLSEPRLWSVVHRLANLALLDCFLPGVVVNEEIKQGLQKIENLHAWFTNKVREENGELWQVALLVMTHRLTAEAIMSCGKRLNLAKSLTEQMHLLQENYAATYSLLCRAEEVLPSEIYGRLQHIPLPVTLAMLALSRDRRAEARLLTYLEYVRAKRITLTGHDLRQMGYRPGPIFKEVLQALTAAKLDGLVQSREEEEEFVRAYLARKEREKQANG